MAAKITHIEVLRQSLYLMEHGSDLQRETASEFRATPFLNRAALGSIAPDIFYFYGGLSRKKNARGQHWGYLIHHTNVFPLIEALASRVRDLPHEDAKRKRLLAFVLGYVSHCAVDIITHPYIFYITGDFYSKDRDTAARAQMNHIRVEYALDSYLVNHRWGMHPHEYNFIQYVENPADDLIDLEIRTLWLQALKEVYPYEFGSSLPEEAPGPDDPIQGSYRGFMRFNQILDTRSIAVRALLRSVDFITFQRVPARALILPPREHIAERLPNDSNRLWKYPADPSHESNESFIEIVHRSARFSVEFMTDILEYIEGKKKSSEIRKKYDGYNLDTGLRSETKEMVEFEPIEEGE
jgi:hypothetical protein